MRCLADVQLINRPIKVQQPRSPAAGARRRSPGHPGGGSAPLRGCCLGIERASERAREREGGREGGGGVPAARDRERETRREQRGNNERGQPGEGGKRKRGEMQKEISS